MSQSPVSKTSTSAINTEVLVVGASPAGLVTACELLRRGVACRLIDANQAPSSVSKFFGLYPRTLELLYQLDVVDELLAEGRRIYNTAIYSAGHQLARFTLDLDQQHTRYNYNLMLSQMKLEQILLKRLESLGGKIEYNLHIKKLTQHERGVTLILSNSSQQEQIANAAWLVGCDGTASSVRNQLGIKFEGSSTGPWMMADVQIDWEGEFEPHDTQCIFFSSESSLLAMPDKDYWRLLDTNPDLTETTTKQEIAAQLTRKLQEATGSSSILVHDPGWASIFKVQQGKAPSLRNARTFLVGDSAYSISPLEAQAMNADVQDAFNLAWKLAMVCEKAAPESLLDSYVTEREPRIDTVLNENYFFTNMLNMRESSARYIRDSMINTLMYTHSLHTSILQQILPAYSEMNITYQPGITIKEDWTPPRSHFLFDQNKGVEPGRRVPDLLIQGAEAPFNHYLLQLLKGNYYTLLIFAGQETHAETLQALYALAKHIKTEYDEFVSVYIVAPYITADTLQWQDMIIPDQGHPLHSLHHHFGAIIPSIYMLRPDGYICYRNQPADASNLLNYLNAVISKRLPAWVNGKDAPQDTAKNTPVEKKAPVFAGIAQEYNALVSLPVSPSPMRDDDDTNDPAFSSPTTNALQDEMVETVSKLMHDHSDQNPDNSMAQTDAPPSSKKHRERKTINTDQLHQEAAESHGGNPQTSENQNSTHEKQFSWSRLLSLGIPQNVL